jgi:ABC-type multidrug transport system ATPase subunit
MRIDADNIGKRYNYEWIFRKLSLSLTAGKAYAILGPNGSGKSTLLNTLSGNITPSEGDLTFFFRHNPVPVDQVYRHLAMAAPYLELVEELTLQEAIQFHSRFKTLRSLSPDRLMERMYLQKAKHKFVKDFSSGMRQRLKLGLALYTEAPLLLLDEPTTNLDQEGVNWYLEHLHQNRQDRLVLIGSNVPHEYSFCDERIDLTDFHPKPAGPPSSRV